MSVTYISAGDTALPSPTKLTINDELIWSEDTGRTLSGRMTGKTIAKKKNIHVEWEMLTSVQVKTIEQAFGGGFFTVNIRDSSSSPAGSMYTFTVYRSTIVKEELGVRPNGAADALWYKTVSVDLIER